MIFLVGEEMRNINYFQLLSFYWGDPALKYLYGNDGLCSLQSFKKADVIEVDLLPRQSPKGTSKSRQIVSQPDLSELERKVELLRLKKPYY